MKASCIYPALLAAIAFAPSALAATVPAQAPAYLVNESLCKATKSWPLTIAINEFCINGITVPSRKARNGVTGLGGIRINVKGPTCKTPRFVGQKKCRERLGQMCMEGNKVGGMTKTFGCQNWTIVGGSGLKWNPYGSGSGNLYGKRAEEKGEEGAVGGSEGENDGEGDYSGKDYLDEEFQSED